MKPSREDEFEEVESPFANLARGETATRSKLRTKKNVFNRPFATGPSVAPAVFDSTNTRRSIGHPDLTDLNHHRQSSLKQAEIEYLNEEEEDEEETEIVPVRRPRPLPASKKKIKGGKNLIVKIGWSIIGLLLLRLVFMDRGVWDYFATESAIQSRQDELQSLKKENRQIEAEISRIQLDKTYQRHLAKEHLGVIASDEFLILFAGESMETPSEDDRRL